HPQPHAIPPAVDDLILVRSINSTCMSSERKPTPKDTWEKIDIVGKGIVLPLAVAALTLVVNMSLSQINERLKTSENDIHLMTTFKDIYYGKGSKRLAVYFTRQISDRNTRHQLEL